MLNVFFYYYYSYLILNGIFMSKARWTEGVNNANLQTKLSSPERNHFISFLLSHQLTSWPISPTEVCGIDPWETDSGWAWNVSPKVLDTHLLAQRTPVSPLIACISAYFCGWFLIPGVGKPTVWVTFCYFIQCFLCNIFSMALLSKINYFKRSLGFTE